MTNQPETQRPSDSRTCSNGHTWSSIRAISACPKCGEKVER